MAVFRKTRPGSMGILTVPRGCRLYRRAGGGRVWERARNEFDVLALPTTSPGGRGEDAYSFKMREEYWYVLKADVGEPEGGE